MLLLYEQQHIMRESDDGGPFHRGPFPHRGHADGRPLVGGVSAEQASCRRTHGSTWVEVDHSTINRWVIKYSPQLEEAFHRRKRPVWVSWRMDETYIRVKGEWQYLYRGVEKHGETIDFRLTEHRDGEAALRFLKKAIRRNGLPETITIDGSDANAAAIKRYNQAH